MNVHDKAHDLARAIKASSEYKSYMEALEEIKKNESSLAMVKDLRAKQVELEQARLLTGQVPEDKLKTIESMMSLISIRPEIGRFLESEMRLAILMADVQAILQEALGDGLDIA